MTMNREDIYMRAERFLFSWESKRDGMKEAEKYTRFVESIQSDFAASEVALARERGRKEEREAIMAKAELLKQAATTDFNEFTDTTDRLCAAARRIEIVRLLQWLREREESEGKKS